MSEFLIKPDKLLVDGLESLVLRYSNALFDLGKKAVILSVL